MILDIRWQLFKLASLAVKAPPLFTFAIGEPVVDNEGHSLVGGALFPGSDLRFEPWQSRMPFDGCEHYQLVFGGNVVEIGIRDDKVQSVSYNYDIYRENGVRRMRKLRHLLNSHSATDPLVEYIDNGSAILYNAKNRTQFAVYGYLADAFLIYSTATKPIRRRGPAEPESP
jgi:hypothetical protein